MSLGNARPQMVRQLTLPFESRSEAPTVERSAEAFPAAQEPVNPGASDLMEEIVDLDNLRVAMVRVCGNKGSPGTDGMTVEDLPRHWERIGTEIRQQLLAGTYRSQPVRRHEIPKSGGGMRELGIPTVLDRLIQQAILQVLQPRFDPTFSESSHGFRPGRSAHDAVRKARGFVQEGKRWVVDVDLERFFDRVNHDILMERLARRIQDQRLLRLIRRYLEAGIMLHGVVVERWEGTPQGGPLSPLLANLLLDEVDKALENCGHSFARYADDCNVYVRSRRAGERVMEKLRGLYQNLRLRINEEKSAVARVETRKFLGYSFWYGPKGNVKLRVADKAREKMKDRVRGITRRTGGRSMTEVIQDLRQFLIGWKNYFQLSETPGIFDSLDKWIRHRLRALQLKAWKRGKTIYRELQKLGASESLAAKIAAHGRRWWLTSGKYLHIILTNDTFDRAGLPRLAT